MMMGESIGDKIRPSLAWCNRRATTWQQRGPPPGPRCRRRTSTGKDWDWDSDWGI